MTASAESHLIRTHGLDRLGRRNGREQCDVGYMSCYREHTYPYVLRVDGIAWSTVKTLRPRRPLETLPLELQ